MSLELYIDRDRLRRTVTIWIEDLSQTKKKVYHYRNKSIEVQEFENCFVSKKMKPFMVLPDYFFDDFLKLLTGYGNDNGAKPKELSYNEGLITAQSDHLLDMKKALDALIKIKTR